MSNPPPSEHLTPASNETLPTFLETLPGALFVANDVDTIVYANASAQTLTGATREELVGKPLWRAAPQLVNTALYQAVQQTKQSRAPGDVEYVSPVTRTWLHVQLVPTVGGLIVHVHQGRAATGRGAPVLQGEHLSIADLDGLNSGIIVLTPEGIVLEINEVPLADAWIRREEVLGQPLAETRLWSCSPTNQAHLRDAIARASRGETVRFETVVHPREGVERHMDVAITPHRDADHHIAYLVLAAIDITARKRQTAEIHALIDAIPQFVWIAKPDGAIISCNQRLLDYLAITREQVEGVGWLAGVHLGERQRVWETWQSIIQTGEPREVEYRLRDGTSGAYRWFLVRALPIHDETGQIVKWLGTCTDIEEQKQTEQQLKASRENWRMLAETVPQLVWVMRSDDWRHEYVNQHWCDYFGLTLEHVQSDPWAYRQFIHPEDRESERACVQHAMDTGTMFEHEERLRKSQTGEYRWFLVRALPMSDETGQIVKWFGTCTDIEEQKRIEGALRQSQERVNALMNSKVIGITINEGEQIVDANETFLRMTGYTREDLCAGRLNWMQMTPPEYLARTFEAHQELGTQQSIMPYEKEYICQDGSRLPVLVGGVLFPHDPFQHIVFVLDNSARKELEQRKDDFISMASHELRNPLAALKLQTTLLRRQLVKQGILDKAPALAGMENQIKIITRLVEELLDVSRIQAGSLEYVQELVDLDVLLREIVETMQHTHPSHRILVRGAVETSLIGDPDRLGQVFTNLLSNAIKYSPGAETVEVDLSTSEDAVTVSVRDHGLGIPREQRDKIFERFYRVTGPRKRAIPGLGMGLYIVAEIVKHHEGTITVESEIGNGSTFTVTFPTRRVA